MDRWKDKVPNSATVEFPTPWVEAEDRGASQARWVVFGVESSGLDEFVNVEWLELYSLPRTPIRLSKFERLRRLDIDHNYEMEDLPPDVFEAPNLRYISMRSTGLRPEYNMARVNALLAGFARAKTPPARRLIESRLLLGRDKRALELASTPQLLAALDNNVKLVRDAALRCLEARLPNRLSEKPLAAGDVVARLGALNLDKDILKEKLAGRGIKLMTKVTAKTTHVLLGEKPRGKQLALGELSIVLQEHLKPFLASSGEASKLDVAAMLISQNEEAIGVAAKTLERSGGVARELWPEILYVHQDTSLKGGGRKAIVKLFAAHAPKKLQKAVAEQMKTSILLAGETTRADRLERFHESAGDIVDVFRLAEIFVTQGHGGAVFLMLYGTDDQADWALGELTIDRALDLSALGIDRVSPRVALRKSLVSLDLSNNRLAEFPREILALGNLEELNLRSNNLHTIPKEIAALGAVRTLILSNNAFASFPGEISSLTNLEVLDISVEAWEHHFVPSIPDAISRLQKLRVLNLSGQQSIKRFPVTIPDLANLEELDVSSTRFQNVPDWRSSSYTAFDSDTPSGHGPRIDVGSRSFCPSAS